MPDQATERCQVFCVDVKKVERIREGLPEVIDVSFYKALSDETRFQLAYALSQEELCVCEVAELMNTTVQNASHHLRRLKKDGLATYRKDGKLVYYRLNPEVGIMIQFMVKWLGSCRSNDQPNVAG